MEEVIEIQQENLKVLIKLMEENPTLKVIPMVDSEVVGSDDYSCWAGKFGEAEIDETWSNEERIYFKSWDEEELIEDEIENLSFISEFDKLSDEELNEMAEKKVDALDWEKVIVLRIRTY